MLNSEEEKLPEFLRSLRKRGDGLTTPEEAYFSAMAGKAIAASKRSAPVRLLYRNWLAVAASVMLLLVAGWWFSRGGTGETLQADKAVAQSSDELLSEINVEEIDAYVSEQIDEFTLELYEEASLKD